MFALVDAGNFYASCEAIFRPSLAGKPVVVLSSNDGCAIARSQEAKALGIKMGQPWFQIAHLAHSHGLVGLSANFTLYGDLSNRLMSLVAGFGHRTEVYSIDEAFTALDGIPGDLTERGFKIRARIERWLGLQCGIGIGATKTLAKLANHVSKEAERKPGSYQIQKAGVILLDLVASSIHQAELDLGDNETDDKSTLMSAVDNLNRRYGRGTVFVSGAASVPERAWTPRQMRLTPQYTTRLEDIPVARA